MPLATITNKEHYRNYIHDIFNQGRFDLLDLYLAPGWIHRTAPQGASADSSSIPGIVRMFRHGFRDFEITLHHMVAEGNWVSCRSLLTGTHTGKFAGIEATGRQISLESFSLIRLENGKIMESWIYNDMEKLRTQLS